MMHNKSIRSQVSAGGELPRVVKAAYAGFGVGPGSRLGVAFSGGADSLALLAASVECGMQCVALHCNFRLRGEESARDEQIALRMARRLGVEVIVKWFDAAGYARRNGVSVEMACRELRYRWFDECRDSLALDAIAVGHNAGDNMETFFLNLARGSGLRGLSGIPRRRQGFVRPLMDVSREAILDYLEQRSLAGCNRDYAVDSTNLQPIFARNRVRLQLLPAAEEALPGLIQGAERSMENLRRDCDLLEELARRQAEQITDAGGAIDLFPLLEMRNAAGMLFHILNLDNSRRADYADAERIIRMARRGASGLRFMVDSGREGYLLDRCRLVPLGDRGSVPGSIKIDAERWVSQGEILFGPWRLKASVAEAPLAQIVETMDQHGVADAAFAVFDLETLRECSFEIRPWRAGDFIEPMGMHGRKKLSDIFKDGKVPLDQKGCRPVVCISGTVVWVAGLRRSRHFAVGSPDYATPKLLLTIEPV